MRDHHSSQEDLNVLDRLRAHRRAHRKSCHHPIGAATHVVPVDHTTFAQRVSDGVVASVGSWRFIIVQSVGIFIWIAYNTSTQQAWDPYPYILLNLLLSFQAAYTAPAIMMSQNRQAEIDRQNAQDDFEVNVKAELEIELLHQKIDLLKEQELLQLTVAVKELSEQLKLIQEASASK
jgi:uncharacterized membrane protein